MFDNLKPPITFVGFLFADVGLHLFKFKANR